MDVGVVSTSVGLLKIYADDSWIYRIYFEADERSHLLQTQYFQRFVENKKNNIIENARLQIYEYFEGLRQSFDLPLFWEQCSFFQRRVLEVVYALPYACTTTYKDIASALQNEKAARAVALALKRNPFLVVVPCHRVIHVQGTLGGYVGGIERKQKLLSLEQRHVLKFRE